MQTLIKRQMHVLMCLAVWLGILSTLPNPLHASITKAMEKGKDGIWGKRGKYTVSQNKCHPFIIVTTLSDVIQFLSTREAAWHRRIYSTYSEQGRSYSLQRQSLYSELRDTTLTSLVTCPLSH